MAVARKKIDAGVAALIDPPEPVSIQEITMLDWYAAFALLGLPATMTQQRKSVEAFETAAEMMKEREKHL